MRFDWSQPPGSASSGTSLRSAGRKILTSLLVGVISVGVAWAGAGLVPVNDVEAPLEGSADTAPAAVQTELRENGSARATFELAAIDPGELLAGNAKISMKPRPDDYGGTWERDYDKCATLPEPKAEPGYPQRLLTAAQEGASHIADLRVKWHENTNCIYMGGYGLGPMFPIVNWDEEYGLWVRSVAMSDGNDTVVLTLLDAVYWEGRYNSMCDGCGFLDLAEQLAAEYGYKETGGGPNNDQPIPGKLGITPASFIFASTHSHTAPDFIGGWGGVPRWYMQQTTDSLKASVTEALGSLRPAVLETGESIARQFNSERRDFYRSAEDDGVSWFRLVEASNTEEPAPQESPTQPAEEPTFPPQCKAPGQATKPECQKPTPSPTPEPTPTTDGPDAIATVAAYAAHPVTTNHENGVADADFPGVFAQRVEDAFGGTGMFLQTGLGNLSPRGNKVEMGAGIASQIPAIGSGDVVSDPDVRVGRASWDHPVTNVPLGALGASGFFDRKFNETPAAVQEGKGPQNRKCTSASAISVDTTVSAAKIGSLWITGAPGETFANYSNTVEERNVNGVTMALALVNDGLGYIIQSFETDHVGRQGTGFVGSTGTPEQTPVVGEHGVGLAEYEDAYSIDHCFGDAALEKTIRLLGGL